jgi:Leucine-rich repeat (LRR) protein
LDVSSNRALTTLDCDNNQLTSLDASKNETLVILSIAGNKFTADALNSIFLRLHNKNIESESKIIFTADNSGTNSSRQKIAKQKGWQVNSTYINE